MEGWCAPWPRYYVGAVRSGGGSAVYYFHYMPEPIGRGHNGSPGTFNFFSAGHDFKIKQPLSQYFVSQLLNLEWVQPGNGAHKIFPAASDIRDGAGHVLVTTYAALRPDGQWSLLIINKDQENAHTVSISFDDAAKKSIATLAGPVSVITFGKAQYAWPPNLNGGTADPDGPALTSTLNATASTGFSLPAASVTVLRGVISAAKAGAK